MNPERWQLIQDLYHEAVEREPGAREEFVATVADADLRAELASLLAQAAINGVLEIPIVAQLGAAAESAPAQLAAYRIVAPLGKVGMGEVYLADDTELGRAVALKVLSRTVADDELYLRRFQEEARLASSLNHPNIVTIYGIGKDKGFAYIAMELVRGRTLRQLLAQGPLPLPSVLELALQVAEALAAAHDGGIMHRDLKPENIMVTAEERVKVLDFGLAKRLSPAIVGKNQADRAHDDVTLTAAGVILGTVGYMSPEQASGGALTQSTDQFSFGAVLYEMLSGTRAFQRPTPVQTLAAIIDEQPPPIHTLNVAVAPRLENFLSQCLAKSPRDRFPLTRRLVEELRAIRDECRTGDQAAAATAVPTPMLKPVKGLTRRRITWIIYGVTASVLSGWYARQMWLSGSGIRSMAVLL